MSSLVVFGPSKQRDSRWLFLSWKNHEVVAGKCTYLDFVGWGFVNPAVFWDLWCLRRLWRKKGELNFHTDCCSYLTGSGIGYLPKPGTQSPPKK